MSTTISIAGGSWLLNGKPTYPDSRAQGLLMNVRMVNVVFEDATRPAFDPAENTARFIASIPEYVNYGIRAFTLCLQGGAPGYEGAINSAFTREGELKSAYMRRVADVIRACDANACVVILGCFYQRQSRALADWKAVRSGVVNTSKWLRELGCKNVLLEISNEFAHPGFVHKEMASEAGQLELINLAREFHPSLLISTSGMGTGEFPEKLARECDFILIHFNETALDQFPSRLRTLKQFGKPIVCNEDEKLGEPGAAAAELCVNEHASWGLMCLQQNQFYPFKYQGSDDDCIVYKRLQFLISKRK